MKRLAPFAFLAICLAATCCLAQEQEALYGEEPRVQHSRVWWTVHAVGPFYTVVLLLSGLLSFIVAIRIVFSEMKHAGATLAFAVALPILIGVFATCVSLVNGLTMYSISDTSMRLEEVAAAIQEALMSMIVALLASAPAFATAFIGLTARSFRNKS